jgi:hypothetical protein
MILVPASQSSAASSMQVLYPPNPIAEFQSVPVTAENEEAESKAGPPSTSRIEQKPSRKTAFQR